MSRPADPRRGALAAVLALLLPGLAHSQGMPPSPVRYTEAREHAVQRTIQLPGTVESRFGSRVASEVAGRVVEISGREGTTVQRGEPLVRLDTDVLQIRRRAAAAQLQEARARFDLAQRTLTRARELLAEEVIPQQDMDNATSEFQAWQGRVDQATAQLEDIDLALERSVIRAPFSGTVVAEACELGEWVAVGEPVVELVSLEDLDVRVEVPERHFGDLRREARAQVSFEALPGVAVEGRVRAIIPRALEGARSFPLLVRIPNTGGRIAAGMLATVSIPAGEEYRAVVVPKDAVITNGNERFVFLINGDDTVSRTPVTPGAGVGEWIVVDGPLQAGTKVVTRGNERLFPGQAVRGEPLDYVSP